MTDFQRVSLFPLKDTVLFPGISLSLHIFEPRYQVMINRCLKLKRPFGVVLIKEGTEVGGQAIPYHIGTIAYITHVQPLDGGRMNIQTVGQQRFQIREIIQEEPFLMGTIEEYPLADTDIERAIPLANELSTLLKSYVRKLAKGKNKAEHVFEKIPEDNVSLAYLAAATLPLSTREKQELLTQKELSNLLAMEIAFLKREMALLKYMIRHQQQNTSPDMPFSPN